MLGERGIEVKDGTTRLAKAFALLIARNPGTRV